MSVMRGSYVFLVGFAFAVCVFMSSLGGPEWSAGLQRQLFGEGPASIPLILLGVALALFAIHHDVQGRWSSGVIRKGDGRKSILAIIGSLVCVIVVTIASTFLKPGVGYFYPGLTRVLAIAALLGVVDVVALGIRLRSGEYSG